MKEFLIPLLVVRKISMQVVVMFSVDYLSYLYIFGALFVLLSNKIWEKYEFFYVFIYVYIIFLHGH